MARIELAGYTRLPGSARRYRTPRGEVISRRQYDNLRARQAGFESRSEIERFRQSSAGRRWRFKLRSHDPSARGDWQTMHAAYEVERRRQRLPTHLTTDRWGKPVEYTRDEDDPELVAAGGPLDELLVALGHRDPGASWNVGETNAVAA